MWSVIVHGGAGNIHPELAVAHAAGCAAAVEEARALLESGLPAMEAVCAAVRVLEDNPVFNAGRGAALDELGVPAMDAALMRGSDLAYGAVACVVGVRHPIDLARAVLEEGRDCLLVGPPALRLARERGLELRAPEWFITEKTRREWQARASARALGSGVKEEWTPEPPASGGTVGAVARDGRGDLAAATSTGGILFRRAGRVGDSPIAGAGTYARNDLAAVSATGHGETMLRTVFAFQLCQTLSGAPPGADLGRLVLAALDEATRLAGGRGGAIAVLPDGKVAWARNTARMGIARQRRGEALCTAF